MDYEQLVTVMRRLSIEAGDKIMEIYGADDFEVKTKSDESPVTIALCPERLKAIDADKKRVFDSGSAPR